MRALARRLGSSPRRSLRPHSDLTQLFLFSSQSLAQRDLSLSFALSFGFALPHKLALYLRIAFLLAMQMHTRTYPLVIVETAVSGRMKLYGRRWHFRTRCLSLCMRGALLGS